jgi:hypothetical protein
MCIVYGLATSLTIVYLAAFGLSMFSRKSLDFLEPEPQKEDWPWHRLRSALYSSFGPFHHALSILTVTILASSVAVATQAHSLYAMQISILLAFVMTAMFFATLPAQLATGQKSTTVKLYACLVAALALAELSLVPMKYLVAHAPDDSPDFEKTCWDRNIFAQNLIVIILLSCIGLFLSLPVLFGVLLKLLVGKKFNCVPEHVDSTLKKGWIVVITVYFLLSMCVLMGLLIYFHGHMEKSAGKPYFKGEKDWTFGQIMALATWMPVLEELIRVLVGKSILMTASA